MELKNWIFGAASTLALVVLAMATQAAPVASFTTDFKVAAGETVDKAASRRCWWRHGRQHCRSYDSLRASANRNGYGDYYVHGSREMPVGSRRWWRQKQEGSAGGM